jgi:hypothetical protein
MAWSRFLKRMRCAVRMSRVNQLSELQGCGAKQAGRSWHGN